MNEALRVTDNHPDQANIITLIVSEPLCLLLLQYFHDMIKRNKEEVVRKNVSVSSNIEICCSWLVSVLLFNCVPVHFLAFTLNFVCF